MFAKNGKEIFPPKTFLEYIPKQISLDGELWKGKGLFEETCTAVIRRIPTEEKEHETLWADVTFNIFDAPEFPGKFEQRIEYSKKIAGENNKVLRVIYMEKCLGKSHLIQKLEEISSKNGEGIMLREPGCAYVHARSKTLLKVKVYKEDEVLMVGVSTESQSLICKARCGENVLVKCSAFDYHHPPSVGTVITIRHTGYHISGKPKFPVFLRVRKDVTWEDIIQESGRKIPPSYE